jgi:hypothetical protein
MNIKNRITARFDSLCSKELLLRQIMLNIVLLKDQIVIYVIYQSNNVLKLKQVLKILRKQEDFDVMMIMLENHLIELLFQLNQELLMSYFLLLLLMDQFVILFV